MKRNALLIKILICLFLLEFANSCNEKKSDYQYKIPFQIINNRIIVKTCVNNSAEVNFIFDTGSTISSIDSTFAAENKIIPYGYLHFNTTCNSVSKPISKCIFSTYGFQSKSDSILIFNLKKVNKKFDLKIYGIIGRDLFQKVKLRLDFESNYIYIYKNLNEQNIKNYKWLWIDKDLTIDAEVNFKNGRNLHGRYYLDTGSNSDIFISALNENNLNFKSLIGEYLIKKDACSYDYYEGITNTLKISTFQINSPKTAISLAKKGILSQSAFKGLIGLNIIRQFDIILDIPNSYIYLRPNKFYCKKYKTK